MKTELSKPEIEKNIKEIFSKNPDKEEIKKIKKLAMSRNIKLGGLRKKFCKKCYSLFNSKDSSIRIKKGLKIIKCKCGYVTRYRIKN